MAQRSGLARLRKDAQRIGRLGGLLWPHVRSHRGLLGAGAGVSLALLVFQLAQPWPLKWIFDVLGGHPAPLEGWPVDQRQLAFAGVYVACAVLAALSEWAQLLLLAGLGNRAVTGFRRELFRHVLQQPLAWHDRMETGELLTRVVSDTARLRRGVNGVLLKTIQTVAIFLATSLILSWLNPALAAVAAGTGVVGLLLMAGTGQKILRAARKQREREGRLAGVVEESLSGIRDLQIHRPDASFDPRFDRRNAKSLKEEQKVRRLEASLFLRVNVLLAVSTCAVLFLGTREVQAGTITAGDLVLFIHYLLALYRPFNVFAAQSAKSGRTLACSERLVKIFQKKPAILDGPEAVAAAPLAGTLGFDDVSIRVSKRHRGGRKRILRNISFEVKAGERVAIVGPNGAGKSSLLLLLTRLVDPRSGSVLVDGRDIRDLTIASYREQISVVPQEPVFFGLSVADNLSLGFPSADAARIESAARRASAMELIEALPQKFRTVVRRRGRLFSAGERQRLAIARALVRDGRIWLLDEPSAGLDVAAAASITELLFEVTAGKTTFWVTHEPAIAQRLDRVLLLVKGKLRYNGTPSGLRSFVDETLPGVKTESLRRYFEQLRA